ncbi:MAG: acyl-CoA thioesterase [candidate division Zixibacteria bacterium]|nr:acyl-CoA thioesterase [candidate division Zixibacteria bacterium]
MKPVFNKDFFKFKTSFQTRFYEVDLQGVVHHSVIIKYLEIGRVEYWKDIGVGYQDFLDSGLQYVVAKVECNYIKPLYFDRMITIMVRTSRVSRTSITYEYLIYNDSDECAIHAFTTLVCIQAYKNKPYPLPKSYLDKIINYEIEGSVENKAFKK